MVNALSIRKNKKNTSKIFSIVLLLILTSAIIPWQSIYAEDFSFNATQNISNTGASSTIPQIIASGGDVYVVWKDGTDILFTNSTNGDTSFGTPDDLGDTGGSDADPRFDLSGNNIYVVWQENNDIKFINSTNNGVSFASAAVQLSSSTNSLTSVTPQIASSTGNDVYVTWHESGDILFRSSADNGLTFTPDLSLVAIDLGDDGGSIALPQITAAGTNVYVIWQDGNDIRFINSTDSGASFPTSALDIGDSSGTDSKPQIAVSGGIVYVVWEEGSQIKLARSGDDGVTFDSPVVVGITSGVGQGNPKVESSGSNVYVVWRQGSPSSSSEIKFRVGTESGGLVFSSEINLSNAGGSSKDPTIAASGSDVRVAWQDSQFGNLDILVRASNDNGVTFGNKENLSQSANFSSEPQIANSGSSAYVVWKEPTANNEIFFASGIPSAISVSFDQPEYKLSDTATITVTDSDSSGTISVSVTSDSDSTGIPSLTLTETGVDTGVFTGQITFSTTSTSGTTLHAAPDDNIVASFSGQNNTVSIFEKTIHFVTESNSVRPDPVLFNPGLFGHVRVTDQNSNQDTGVAETIDVIVNSTANPDGVTLTLTETGVDTGIFGGGTGPTQSNLIFTNSSGLVPISTTSSVTITQIDEDNAGGTNEDPFGIDDIWVDITSDSDSTGISVQLFETDVNTATYTGKFFISTTASNNATDTILVAADEFIAVSNRAGTPLTSMLLVTPNSVANNALQVINPIDTNIKATYQGATRQAQMNDEGGLGGGGGGLVRPSLVVNALGGLAGGGSAYSSPTLQLSNLVKLGQIDVPLEIEQMIYEHDSSIPASPMALGFFKNFDYPLIINDKGFVLSGFSTTLETQTLQTNTPHTIKFLYYESDKIQHFSLYTNLRDANTAIHQSDTQILYNDGQELQIVDPNGFFESVSFTLNELDDLKKQIVLEITFAKEMDTTDIIVRAWDPLLNSFDTYILDAIKVVSGEIDESPIPTYEEPVIEELQSTSIPKWIKNNAAWWSEQQISDSDFVSGIEYLIKNEIINVPGVEVGTGSATTEIPDWIQNNAGWWAESLITDGDFIEGIQWLIGNGVIQI